MLFDEALLTHPRRASLPSLLEQGRVPRPADLPGGVSRAITEAGRRTGSSRRWYAGRDQGALENDLILPPVIELVEAGSVAFAPKSKVIEDHRGELRLPAEAKAS